MYQKWFTVSEFNLNSTSNFSSSFVLKDLAKGNLIKPADDPDQQTIIRIPENLLPLFMPKKDPVKLGKCIVIDF